MSITYRKVTKTDNDGLKILSWRNDDTTRQMSFNTNIQKWDDFKLVFYENYFNNSVNPIIIQYNNIDCGFIGFVDNQTYPNAVSIGINISPQFRGKNIGTKSLQIVNEYLRNYNIFIILAEIKKQNIASIKTFEKNNYVFMASYNNNNCIVHKYFYRLQPNFVLGTCQLGMQYGIVNNTTNQSITDKKNLLTKAYKNGIIYYDTASAYGMSEELLGQTLNTNANIITKLGPHCKSVEDVQQCINNSLDKLKVSCLHVVLLHNESQYNTCVWDRLLHLQCQGLISKVGISSYNVTNVKAYLNDKNVQWLQIPVNYLDNQWNDTEFLLLCKKRQDVTIHIRSIYLQGLLLSSIDKWPKFNTFDCQQYIDIINTLCTKYSMTKIELAIAYSVSQKWTHGVVIGVDNEKQLSNNLTLFSKTKPLTYEQIKEINNNFINVPSNLLNPSNWTKN